MKQLKEMFSRIKLVRRRSSNLTKIVVIITIVLCMGALLTLRLSMNRIKQETRELAAQAAELEQDKSDLNTQIDQLGSVQSVLDIAEQELGLVNPDTVIFEPVN